MEKISQKLLQAYEDALYRVDGSVDFRVGEPNDALRELHETHNAKHSHFVTAFNPASKRLPAEENAARHAELDERLDEMGARKLAAAGLDPEGQWPPEPGYLVFDMTHDDVVLLGRAYGQNAVVSIGADGIASLVLISEPE